MFEMNHFKSIDELVKFFPTEQSCIDFLENGRDGVIMSCLHTIQTQRFINARETDTSARIRGSISTSGQTRSSRTRKCR